MRYIRQIHLEYPATSNQHISQIRFSTTPTGAMATETRASVIRNIENRWQSYYWYDERSGDEGRVITGSTDWGTKCIATAHDEAAADLLKLPRF